MIEQTSLTSNLPGSTCRHCKSKFIIYINYIFFFYLLVNLHYFISLLSHSFKRSNHRRRSKIQFASGHCNMYQTPFTFLGNPYNKSPGHYNMQIWQFELCSCQICHRKSWRRMLSRFLCQILMRLALRWLI